MPQYPPSGFEALVGNFLSSYAQMKGLKMQQRESDQRAQQAKTADQLAQIQMNEAGYDRISLPKIEAPPDQGFFSKVGHFLSGGPEQPGLIVMKTHQSTRERETQDARTAHVADVAESERFDLELEGIKAANERERTRMNNRTQITVAGMQKQPNAQDATKDEIDIKHQIIDDAINANGGYAQKAYDQIPGDVKRKYRIGATDMNAGTQRFTDRRAALAREAVQSREDIADKKGSNKEAFRRQLLGQAGGGDPAAQQRADWDAAAAAAKQQGKDPVQLLGPRP